MTLGEFTKTDMYQFGDVIYLADEDGKCLDFPDDGSIDDREVIGWRKYKKEGSIRIVIENGKPLWNVHFGVRLTYDVEVKAKTKKEAIELARAEWDNVTYNEMEYADQDVEAWIE